MTTTSRAKINLVLAHMKDGRLHTAAELADATGIERTAVCHAMAQMRKADLIHIVEWRNLPAGGTVSMHVIGKGISAPKPSNPKRHEANRLRAARKASEERRAERERLADTFAPFRDPLTVAFYGEYQREATCQTA